MPSRTVIEDSDEEASNDNSPVKSPKPALEESPVLILDEIENPSQVLSRDIQDAYSHLLEPSTSRSSRSSHPSSGSPLASKRRATTDSDLGRPRKTKVTYGARKSRDDFHLGALSEDEEPVKMRKRARLGTDVEQNHDEARQKDEDQRSGSTSPNGTARPEGSTQLSTSDRGRAPDASMPPPASRTPVSSRQLVHSSSGSTIPCTERASFPPSAAEGTPSIPTGHDDASRPHLLSVESLGGKTSSNPKPRKRSVSDLESPEIILGEEFSPSSSAPTESPLKQAHIDSPRTFLKSRSGSGKGHDELSPPVTRSPRSKRKQAKPRESELKSASVSVCHVDELGSDDLVPHLPKENYQPRPSRSRSALTADEVIIPEDFSKRPEALAKSKKTPKRRKTTAFEEASEAVEPPAMQQQDPGIQAHAKRVLASVSESREESSPQLSLPRKKSRGRPKKDALPEEQPTAPSIPGIPSAGEDADLKPVSPVKQVGVAPVPAKRGRKRKTPAAKCDENPAQDILPESKTHFGEKNTGLLTETALAESDPNIQPFAMYEDESSTMQAQIKHAETEQASDRSPRDSASPVKLKTEEQRSASKANSSAKLESKSTYRVGLSKRQRIPSLLRVVRK
ncbi:MAG: hypothetical protein Q9196_002084 [Gyalolechia fulgens]